MPRITSFDCNEPPHVHVERENATCKQSDLSAPIVRAKPLIAALERGSLAGAALDVTVEEPLPAGSPLWAMPNVILTPHVSGLSADMWERAMDMFVEHVRAYQDGRPLPNLVDKRAGYRVEWE